MMNRPIYFAELRRNDDDGHVAVVQVDQLHSLPWSTQAEVTAHYFLRGHDGRRVDLGTLPQIIRDLGIGQDYSRSRVAISREVRR